MVDSEPWRREPASKKGNYKLTVHQFYALLKQTKCRVVDESAKCVTNEVFRFITECPELAQKVMRENPKLIWGDE